MDVTGISARGVAVDSITAVSVAVGSVTWVIAGEGTGDVVVVSVMDVGEVVTVAGLALPKSVGTTMVPLGTLVPEAEMSGRAGVVTIAEGLKGMIPVGGKTVGAGVKAWGAGLLSRYKNKIKSMIATINLKIS